MAVGTLGMTMNDWPGTALALAALWLLVRAIVSGGAWHCLCAPFSRQAR